MHRDLHAPVLFSALEAASILHVTPRTIQRLIGSGTLRGVRVGKILRVPASEIDRVLAGTGGVEYQGRQSSPGRSRSRPGPVPDRAVESGGLSALRVGHGGRALRVTREAVGVWLEPAVRSSEDPR